jgi:hypothetical protein
MCRTLLACALATLLLPSTALARDYHVASANETFRVARDGSVHVTERLTFAFDGSYHGAYRLIPALPGESISDVAVAEDGSAYSPGADPAVGSAGDPDTFGVTTTAEGWTQVAWHFVATDEQRTFTLSYVMHGYVRAYRDVDNLYLQVWGSQWTVPLDRLNATIELPGAARKTERPLLRIWGHPASVHGSTAINSPSVVTLAAVAVPPRQFVEADVTWPSRLVTGGDVHREPGNGLTRIVERERQLFSSPYGDARSSRRRRATSVRCRARACLERRRCRVPRRAGAGAGAARG